MPEELLVQFRKEATPEIQDERMKFSYLVDRCVSQIKHNETNRVFVLTGATCSIGEEVEPVRIDDPSATHFVLQDLEQSTSTIVPKSELGYFEETATIIVGMYGPIQLELFRNLANPWLTQKDAVGRVLAKYKKSH